MKLHLWIRLKTALNVLFSYQHFFLINMSTDELKKYFSGEDIDFHIINIGLHRHNLNQIIKDLSTTISDVDLILGKAQFEAEAELRKEN